MPPGRTLSQTKCGHEQDDWPEATRKANIITIKPEAASHVAEQFSWVPLPSCSPLKRPFPIKPFALSVHLSPQIIHFRVLDKSPLLGPRRRPPSGNNSNYWGFPGGAVVENLPANAGDTGSSPGLERSHMPWSN